MHKHPCVYLRDLMRSNRCVCTHMHKQVPCYGACSHPCGLCLLVRRAGVCDAVVNACENACEMLSGVRVVGIKCLSRNIRSGVT